MCRQTGAIGRILGVSGYRRGPDFAGMAKYGVRVSPGIGQKRPNWPKTGRNRPRGGLVGVRAGNRRLTALSGQGGDSGA